MRNHIAVAKVLVMAARALAIGLLTIGLGGNSTWAGSEQASGLQSASISSEVVFQPVTAADPTHRSTTIARPKKLLQLSQPGAGPATRISQNCATLYHNCRNLKCCPGEGSCKFSQNAQVWSCEP